jgi:hypothetical protein
MQSIMQFPYGAWLVDLVACALDDRRQATLKNSSTSTCLGWQLCIIFFAPASGLSPTQKPYKFAGGGWMRRFGGYLSVDTVF